MPRFTFPILTATLGLGLATSALAANFSVSGPGGNIPSPAASPGTWNVNFTGTAFTSTVSLVNPVTSITALKLGGFQHTWRGDLHIFLLDPNNVGYNIVVRPGSSGATAGDSGNYNLGDYTFVESGGGTVQQGSTNINGGTYDQFFNTGTGQWTLGIANAPLTGITGPAGTWTLEIRDWAAGDVGSLTGWTLEGVDTGTTGITPYCGAGDPVVTTPCASGAPGNPGNGCANSSTGFTPGAGGANLSATGVPSQDNHVMTQAGELPTSLSIFLQGDANTPQGIGFGDGVRCVDGGLLRLYVKNAVGGVVSAPAPGDPSIQTQSASLGSPIAPGQIRFYQVYYRDPSSFSGLNFNVGNALKMNY